MQSAADPEHVERFDIADAHLGCALSQATVERFIARRVECTANPKRAIQAEDAVRSKNVTDQGKHALHGGNAHDVRGVRRIHSIE